MAAVLACGSDAVLSHVSAAELWKILPAGEGAIHVSVIAGYERRRSGVVVHRRVALAASEVSSCAGIPATTPACTLVDIAPQIGRNKLERAINAANTLDLVDPEELRAQLENQHNRAGVDLVRKVLDRRTFVLTDSELERRFVPIAHAAGLPLPETQARLAEFRVDFYWPGLGLVVETDGLRYHRTAAQQSKDRERDQALAAAGLTVLRFTHAQVRYESARVKAILTRVARRLAATTAEERSL
jgi:very-short-patch-repair endonuclease